MFSALLDHEDHRLNRLPRFESDHGGLAALLSMATMAVGGSTGPVHLAAAVGTPTLMLNPPWPSCRVERRGPYSDIGWSLSADLAEARDWTRRTRRRLGERLMAGIPSTAALTCIRAIMNGEAPALGDDECPETEWATTTTDEKGEMR